ncbi:hypothetical protein VP01_30g8 [Puccinia sorghi]|uniref:DOC domain-containing protein n=1 Tax=Puccinia sorghi TaxID=27349 RepID=A0A0L6V1A9_9BASI|nr:hypothetical protein VP01_30g8 [Puccinia sorghi]
MEGENTNEPLVSCGKPFLHRKDEIDLGDLGLWSVSSAKPGFGVENLRDDSVHTLWQSEGPQPHFIRIEFPKRTIVTVSHQISMFVDVTLDDSYTPCKLSISLGTFKQDLQVVKMIELINPRGWHHIRLVDREEEEPGDDEDSDDSDSGWVCTERPLVPSRNLGQSSQRERYTHPVPKNIRTSIVDKANSAGMDLEPTGMS